MIALMVITDGRLDCIGRTIDSALAMLHGEIGERWIYDDSGDPHHRAWLHRQFGSSFEIVTHPAGRQGFGGAIRVAWQTLRNHSLAHHVFHLEDDFTFNRPVPLDLMAQVLDLSQPTLAQIALRRQPWNPTEKAAGGVVEVNPDGYVDKRWVDRGTVKAEWLEHRLFWTTNPSIYRRDLVLNNDWPTGPESEGRFGFELFAAGKTCAYWGARDSGEWVHHIGVERAGTGY